MMISSAGLILVIVALLVVFALKYIGEGHVADHRLNPRVVVTKSQPSRVDRLQGEIRAEESAKKKRLTAGVRRNQPAETKPASAGKNGTAGQVTQPHDATLPSRTYAASFAALENEISGEIGIAYAPLGTAKAQTLGPLQVGHAWSSFKVPIAVTVMLEQGGSLTSSQESLAASAITASDNEAAAALFSELESRTGGHAAAAVETTLAKAEGASVEVSTAPPPPGAVSSWGQTEWPLSASTAFYGALACGAYNGETAAIIGDMESVIPEQQWGLGQAPFPAGTNVAIKAGWGPDGSESGPYLVRQAGIIRSSAGGAVVTIAAQDSDGSFEAGVADLDRVADWASKNVPLGGSC